MYFNLNVRFYLTRNTSFRKENIDFYPIPIIKLSRRNLSKLYFNSILPFNTTFFFVLSSLLFQYHFKIFTTDFINTSRIKLNGYG